jgi:hypothetical protein
LEDLLPPVLPHHERSDASIIAEGKSRLIGVVPPDNVVREA